MSDIGNKIKYFFGLETVEDKEKVLGIEDQNYIQNEQIQHQKPQRAQAIKQERKPEYQRPVRHSDYTPSPTPVQSAQKAGMVIYKYSPEDFREAISMIDDIKNGDPVIINFENTQDFIAAKIYNICEGAAYALEANISKISNSIFIVAPKGVNLKNSQITPADKKESEH